MADDKASLKELLAGDYALALSGGGIRSATISLGMAQALAKAGRLDRLRTVSTVSGGGYFGAFFKSLYIAQAGRGLDGKPDLPPTADRAARVLKKRNSPEIKWLRQHSRYLAPNGSGDYWSAIATLTRNWAALAYLFLIAVAVAAFALLLVQIGIVCAYSGCAVGKVPKWIPAVANLHGVSPVIWAAVPAVLASAATGVAYWYSEPMPTTPASIGEETSLDVINTSAMSGLGVLAAATIFAVILIGLLLCISFATGLPAPLNWLWWAGGPRVSRSAALPAIVAGAGFSIITAATAFLVAARFNKRRSILATAVRRRLTEWRATALQVLIAILAWALIDTTAISLRQAVHNEWKWPFAGIVTAAVVTFTVHRVAKWGQGSSKPILAWLGRNLKFIALLLGASLWGCLAVAADTGVHALVWTGGSWDSPVDPGATVIGGVALVLLFILTLMSDGFVNLSSLHNFYASRLTRAYLGASNEARVVEPDAADKACAKALDPAVKVTRWPDAFTKAGDDHGAAKFTETHPADYIDAQRYFMAKGPDHIVNISLAQTRDPKTGMAERDRQALILSIGRDGMRSAPVGESATGWTFRPWPTTSQASRSAHETDLAAAESLPIGQWIAISGAAAGTGMGRMTSAGGALLFTFANVRLGYWWRRGEATDALRWAGPYRYLLSEMLALYRSDSDRVYLSDGGHFENSGVYGILLRQAADAAAPHPGVIIVADNGQDEGFRFEDLEQLTRRARLDLGWSIEAAEPDDVARRAGQAADLFLNASKKRWRKRARDPNDGAIALWLIAEHPEGGVIDIIWLKPRVTADLPIDVAGYAQSNPNFPHQSTGDQFFDEAQFESYRVLGDCMMARLID